VIRLYDKQFIPFISSKEIDFAIQQIAKSIENDFADEIPVFIGVLNGSFMFVSDIMKQYKSTCELNFIKLSSYNGLISTNEVKKSIGLNQDLTGRTVIIFEDIVDTGATLLALKEIFKVQNVKHLKIATLFFKPEALKHDVKIDYIGIRIPNKFIVGYGLDYNGLGRNLTEVYQLVE
jgi:hypoxanthine phosphoribosyltransferase